MPETADAKVQTKIINETASGANNCGMSDPRSWMNKAACFIRGTK
jgi:hypothetical protein